MSENTGAIVVGVDGSENAISAAQWAAAVAARYESPLHIVYAMPSVGRNLTETALAVRAAVMSYQRDFADAYLRDAADAVRSRNPELAVSTEAMKVAADEALIQCGRTAQMIVVATSEVSPVGALFVGSTALAVATHAACPVVAWRGPNQVPTDQPIVVGADATHSSAVALQAAFEFADRFKVKLAAVHSWAVPWPATAVANPFVVDWDALEAAQWAQLAGAVEQANQRHPHVNASCFVEPTKPTASLLHQVEEDGAQLVVVGNRGRSPLASAVLGSTALNLLHHSTVPVMVCRAADDEDTLLGSD